MTKKTSKLTDKKGKSQTAFAGQTTGTSDQEWQNALARFDAYQGSFRSNADFEAETERQLRELQDKGYRL